LSVTIEVKVLIVKALSMPALAPVAAFVVIRRPLLHIIHCRFPGPVEAGTIICRQPTSCAQQFGPLIPPQLLDAEVKLTKRHLPSSRNSPDSAPVYFAKARDPNRRTPASKAHGLKSGPGKLFDRGRESSGRSLPNRPRLSIRLHVQRIGDGSFPCTCGKKAGRGGALRRILKNSLSNPPPTWMPPC